MWPAGAGDAARWKVRELVAAGEVEVRWIDTKENLADLLSKGTLDPVKFDELK